MRAVLLLVVLCTACVNQRDFAPRENRNGEGPTGRPAAVYPVGAPPGLGEVRLWSSGARGLEVDGVEVVEIGVGFELENTGAAPLVLDTGSLRCVDVQVGEQSLPELGPVRVEGSATVSPGSRTRVDVAFRPAGVERARDISAFAVRFRVLAGTETALEQVTPFVPYVRDPGYDDDWRWHSYWGFGLWWRPLHGAHCW